MPADEAKEAEEDQEKQHNLNEALNANAKVLTAVSTMETTPTTVTDLTTAAFIAKGLRTRFVADWRQMCNHRALIIPTIAMDFYFALPK